MAQATTMKQRLEILMAGAPPVAVFRFDPSPGSPQETFIGGEVCDICGPPGPKMSTVHQLDGSKPSSRRLLTLALESRALTQRIVGRLCLAPHGALRFHLLLARRAGNREASSSGRH